MKKVLAVVSALVLLSFAVGANAQGVPNFQVYFDAAGSQAVHPAPCPGFGVLDTWHVIANNVNSFFNVAEFSIAYPPNVVWLADSPALDPIGGGANQIGSTPTGTALGWAIQMNGFNSILVCKLLVLWNCADCAGWDNTPVVVGPGFNGTLVVTLPGNNILPMVGMTSTICATPVPVENKTWGKVKALYNSN